MENVKLKRMLTFQGTIDQLKKEDPQTAITLHFIKTLVKQNKIPYFKAGVKTLINYDLLIQYLNNELPSEGDTQEEYYKMHKIKE